MTSLSWTSAAPDTEPHTRGDWRLLAAAVGLALFVYAPELGSFSLSIDEEIHGLSDSVAREWVQQGRWGMGLLCSVLPPLQAIPFLPTFLFCLGLAAGAWRAAGLATRSRSEAVFFIATCIICPVWMHIAEFNTLSWGFGIGLAAVMAAAAACAHGGLSSLVAAVLLLAFGIGIYQTLVIPFALVMLMAGIRRVEEPAPWAAAVRPLVLRSIVVLAAALVTYALVSRISLWFIGSGLRYVDGYANLRAFTGPDAAAAVQRTLRTSLGYFTGQSPLFLGWGAAVLTPVWLGCLGGLVGIWRHDTGRTPQVRWGHTAILIAGFGVSCSVAAGASTFTFSGWLSVMVRGFRLGQFDRLRLLGLVLVIRAAIDFEFLEHLAAQLVLWKHPSDGQLDDSLGPLVHHLGETGNLAPAGMMGVPVVLLLLGLLAGDPHLLGVDDHNIVAHVHVRRVRRLGLAHQNRCDLGGHPPEDRILGVHQQPFLLDAVVLGHEALHSRTLFLFPFRNRAF